MDFKLHAPYSATGDQPEAIRKLTEGVRLGLDEQVLLLSLIHICVVAGPWPGRTA